MKIELKKEINAAGETWYNVWADGKYISSHKEYAEAINKYDAFCKTPPQPKTEVLKTFETDTDAHTDLIEERFNTLHDLFGNYIEAPTIEAEEAIKQDILTVLNS